ncbi:MAG: hypothetical protein KDB01_23130 [Planctomycetaceae bacterium]|nr:hypothetical protein [Planctomycetaceae bacterium]
MSRLACLFAGLLMVSSLSGCCLLGHGGGYAPYGGGGYYGGGSGGSCGCGAQANGYPSAMLAPGMQQTAFAQPQIGGYPAMAAVPQDVLGTF